MLNDFVGAANTDSAVVMGTREPSKSSLVNSEKFWIGLSVGVVCLVVLLVLCVVVICCAFRMHFKKKRIEVMDNTPCVHYRRRRAGAILEEPSRY